MNNWLTRSMVKLVACTAARRFVRCPATIADPAASGIQSFSTGESAEDMQIYRLLARCLGARLIGSLVSTVNLACDKAIRHLVAPLESLTEQ